MVVRLKSGVIRRAAPLADIKWPGSLHATNAVQRTEDIPRRNATICPSKPFFFLTYLRGSLESDFISLSFTGFTSTLDSFFFFFPFYLDT